MAMQDLILVRIKEMWPSEGGFLETDELTQENMEGQLTRIQDLTALHWVRNASKGDSLESEKGMQRNLNKLLWSAYHSGKLRCLSCWKQVSQEVSQVAQILWS